MKNLEKVLSEVKETLEFMHPDAADSIEAQDIYQLINACEKDFKYLSRYISEVSVEEISKEMEVDKFYVERGIKHEIEELGKRVPLFLDYKNEITKSFGDKIKEVYKMLDYARDRINHGSPDFVKGIRSWDRYINLNDIEVDQLSIEIETLVEDAFQAGLNAQ